MTDLDPHNPHGLRWSVEGWTPDDALAALRGLEREAFPPGAVPFFAALDRQADGTMEWTVPGAAAYGFYELDEPSRENLKARIGRRIGQLRRAIEARARAGDAQAPRLGALLRDAVEVPGWGSIYAVSGEPVLAGWGHIEAGRTQKTALLIGLDDGIDLPVVARRPWTPWLAAAAALVLLLLGGLATAAWAPLAWLPVEVNLPRCQVESADLGLIDGYDQQRASVEDLQRQLAETRRSIDQKTMACPVRIVEVQEPPKELPKEPPKDPPKQQAAAPPPPKQDLPEDKWNKKDVSMLQGCWTRISNMRVKRVGGPEFPVRSWRICFDQRGRGKQDLVWENGTTCSGPVTARFTPGGELRMDEAQAPCSDNSYNFRATTECQRRDDGTADCVRRLPNGGVDEGRLRR